MIHCPPAQNRAFDVTSRYRQGDQKLYPAVAA
jgi:hypothetical protein